MNQLLAIAFLLAACGDDGVNTLPDAPPLPGDSPTDAPPQPVTLTVTIAGTPARDVPVIFQNAQSMVVLATMTDATGKASAVLEPGGFVTALEPQVVADLGGIPLVNDDLTTFSGVKPGDELQLELARGGGSGTDVTFDIVVPEDPNAASYSLYTSCGDVDITPIIVVPVLFGSANNPARSVTLTGCNGMADMAVVTYDASFVPLQSYYQADVAVADAQLVTLAGPYQAIASTSMTVSNPAADLGAINVEHRIATARGSIYETFGSLNQGSTSFTGAIATPVTTNTTAVVRLDVFRTGPDPASNQQVIEWGPTSATYTADWAAIALPDFATRPTFDPASHAIEWTETAGVAPDFVIATYRTFRAGGNPEHAWNWRIVAPRTTARALLPTLPPINGFDFNTVAGDSFNVNNLTTVKAPGGYDAVREQAFGPLDALVIGATGRVVAVHLQAQSK